MNYIEQTALLTALIIMLGYSVMVILADGIGATVTTPVFVFGMLLTGYMFWRVL